MSFSFYFVFLVRSQSQLRSGGNKTMKLVCVPCGLKVFSFFSVFLFFFYFHDPDSWRILITKLGSSFESWVISFFLFLFWRQESGFCTCRQGGAATQPAYRRHGANFGRLSSLLAFLRDVCQQSFRAGAERHRSSRAARAQVASRPSTQCEGEGQVLL